MENDFTLKLMKTLSYAFNPIALRKAKIAYNFGLSEWNKVKEVVASEATLGKLRLQRYKKLSTHCVC